MDTSPEIVCIIFEFEIDLFSGLKSNKFLWLNF